MKRFVNEVRHPGEHRHPGESRDPGFQPVSNQRRQDSAPIVTGAALDPLFSSARHQRYPTVYILASERNGTLYIGVTSNLIKRCWEHRNNLIKGFSQRYGVHLLVWFENHETMNSAIDREKAIKEWKRKWKLELIENSNPDWRDLYNELL